MSLVEAPLFPTFVYLALVAGLWLVSIAVISPGTGIYELLAFFVLVLAGLGLTALPINLWAIFLLLAGVLLFVLSVFWERLGEVWLIVSAVVLSVGSVFIFHVESGRPAVHPVLAVIVSLLTLGFYWFAVRKTLSAQRSRPRMDPSLVIGEIGEVRTVIDPVGSIYVSGELWSAMADQQINPGAKVRVIGREGLTLQVERVEL